MGESKILNTRIRLKYDSFNNWTTNNPVLLKGELAVVEVANPQNNISQVPAVLLKVGDGTTTFNQLPWCSALAADVHKWAKQPNKPEYDASEIKNLENYISGKVEDTNTQYQIVKVNNTSFKIQSKEKGETTWKDGETIQIVYTLSEGASDGTVNFNGVDVAVHGLGSAAYTDAGMYEVAGEANKVQTEVVGTIGDDANKITIYGTRKFIEVKTASVQESALQQSKTYTDNQINAKIGSVYKPQGSINFANLPNPVVATQLGYVWNVNEAFSADDRFVSSEVGKKFTAGTNVAVIIQGNKYYLDALSGSIDLTNYATNEWTQQQLNNLKENLIGQNTEVAATNIKGAVVESKQYSDNIQKSTDARIQVIETKLGTTTIEQQIKNEINKLNKSDNVVTGQFVSSVSETNGIITVTRNIPRINDIENLQSALDKKANDSEFAKVAKTGNINDLEQNLNDYIVFDCGSSSSVI